MVRKKKNLLVAKTKAEFVKILKTELEKELDLTMEQSKKVYEIFTKIMKETIATEEKLTLNGFGTFKMRKLKARKGINPRTQKEIQIKASKTVGFKPTPSFKDEL